MLAGQTQLTNAGDCAVLSEMRGTAVQLAQVLTMARRLPPNWSERRHCALPSCILSPVKTCRCGASYDLSSWSGLQLLGRQADRRHRVANLEVRRCEACGSSLATRTASERSMPAVRPSRPPAAHWRPTARRA